MERVKVICVNNISKNDHNYDTHLTIGKIYNTYENKTGISYNIENDIGWTIPCSADWFITLEEYRNNQIDKIIKND